MPRSSDYSDSDGDFKYLSAYMYRKAREVTNKTVSLVINVHQLGTKANQK